MYIITHSHRDKKPPLGSQINWSHPLSKGLVGCWLMNEGGGNPVNLVTRDAFVVNQATWVNTKRGAGMRVASDTSSPGLSLVASNDFKKNNVTIVWFGSYFSIVGGVPNTRLFSVDYDNANSAPYISYGFLRSADYTIGFGWNNGSYQSYVTGDIVSYNKPIMAVLAIGSKADSYIDGVLKNSSSAVGNISYSATTRILVGNNSSIPVLTNSDIYYGLIYSRALSPSEIQQLYIEPYCFIAPQRRRFFSTSGTPPVVEEETVGYMYGNKYW